MRFENIYLNFGTQVVYDNASSSFNANDKVGMIVFTKSGKHAILRIVVNYCIKKVVKP